jgi:uncharacterized protein (TIGR02145 family)
MNKVGCFLILFIFALTSCGNKPGEKTAIKEKPYNPKDYPFKTIKVGNSVWMCQNLNVVTYDNGDSIPQAKTQQEWVKYNEARVGAWCAYDFDTQYVKIYGRIYNEHVLYQVSKSIAPKGWHVASDDEWDELVNYTGGYRKAAHNLKSTGNIKDKTGLWIHHEDQNPVDVFTMMAPLWAPPITIAFFGPP